MLHSPKQMKGLSQAQADMEQLVTDFERREFSATVGRIKVILTGDMKVKTFDSVKEGDGGHLLSEINEAYQTAMAQLEHERNLGLVRIRNAILKKFKLDIKNSIPEISRAVAYFDQRQSLAS